MSTFYSSILILKNKIGYYKMVIYKITNKINGKCYIGKTTKTVEWRWKIHIIHSKRDDDHLFFHRAIKKYGVENFILEIIDTADNENELNEKEKYWIEYYKSYLKENGYNLTKGGEGGALVGDALERMKKSKKGKKHSEKQKASKYTYLKGINKGEKNAMYGKKPANANKTMEEFFGKERADEIKQKIAKASKEATLNSKKFQAHLQRLKDKYYENPIYCNLCGNLIPYETGYKYHTCKKCRDKKKGN